MTQTVTRAIEKVQAAELNPTTFSVQYPPARRYFRENFKAPVQPRNFRDIQQVALYAHVPFCESNCSHCTFAVHSSRKNSLYKRYVDALISELSAAQDLLSSAEIRGIHVGGTPTILPTGELLRLAEALLPMTYKSRSTYALSTQTTASIAANESNKLIALAQAGFSRISLGLRNTIDAIVYPSNRDEQQRVGLLAVESLLRCGFQRVSVDLIFGLPGQTQADWLLDLKRVVAFQPDTIVTHDCIYRDRVLDPSRVPTPNFYGELYDSAYEYLLTHGYFAPYGSVTFSRHLTESGTPAYFEGRLFDGLPYLGLGNSASSMRGDQWWLAPHKLNEWLKRVETGEHFPVGDSYNLPSAERMAKYLLLSLSFGMLDTERFLQTFGVSLTERFGAELALAEERHWLEQKDRMYMIGKGQFRNIAKIRSLFYSDSAIAWLAAQMR